MSQAQPRVLAVPVGAEADAEKSVPADADVLDVETSLSDSTFETRDDSSYVVHLKNRSQYFVADDILVTADLVDPKTSERIKPLYDGTMTLDLIPRTQRVRCLAPGQTAEVVFKVISRGIEPDLYWVDVSTQYELVYFEKRAAQAMTQQPLPVQGGGVCFDIPFIRQQARMPRQPTPQRSDAMPKNESDVMFPKDQKPMLLLAIVIKHDLPDAGYLEVSYRLVKRPQRSGADPDRFPSTYGLNPTTNNVESYFSSQDQAVLEVTLNNASQHHLKHVYCSDIRLTTEDDQPVNETLPDGNLLFELVPDNSYFGHIGPGKSVTNDFSLITRGTRPGRYVVQMDANFDIEAFTRKIKLGLLVNRD